MGVFLIHVVPGLLYVLTILGVKMMSTIELINDELNFRIKSREFLMEEILESFCEEESFKLMDKLRRVDLIIDGLNLMKENIEKGDKNAY